jgi:hypothetical protein
MGLLDSLSESGHFLFCIDDEGRRTDKTALKSSSDDDTDGIIGKGDGYLHPYVPLMTNCIEYLHSSNSPINHDQLMKNNKSLTSSP